MEKQNIRDYIPEQNQVQSPIDMDNIDRYKKKKDAICKLITGSGTGFICQTKIKDKTMKLLFNSFPTKNIKNKKN